MQVPRLVWAAIAFALVAGTIGFFLAQSTGTLAQAQGGGKITGTIVLRDQSSINNIFYMSTVSLPGSTCDVTVVGCKGSASRYIIFAEASNDFNPAQNYNLDSRLRESASIGNCNFYTSLFNTPPGCYVSDDTETAGTACSVLTVKGVPAKNYYLATGTDDAFSVTVSYSCVP
ncbi:MAG: hypothetical protein HY392_05495 [Candidatus Diapherotrites archaeon]|nr:hypothetical protein [Candidatus Diapherotrites archaeon]